MILEYHFLWNYRRNRQDSFIISSFHLIPKDKLTQHIQYLFISSKVIDSRGLTDPLALKCGGKTWVENNNKKNVIKAEPGITTNFRSRHINKISVRMSRQLGRTLGKHRCKRENGVKESRYVRNMVSIKYIFLKPENRTRQKRWGIT